MRTRRSSPVWRKVKVIVGAKGSNANETAIGVMETVGRRLCETRSTSGYTRGQVAGLVEISLRSLGRYETGKRLPRSDTLVRLASAYKRPAGWFFEEP
jgi:DNA-binding XRE family transcriptional regulator